MIGAANLPNPGARIGVVCGPGELPKDRAGTVICHVTDRWGTHALVMMDDGATKTCHSVNTRPGIGWHPVRG